MLIDQQQKPSETLQEYIQRFLDLLLKSRGLLPHQAKDLVHITHFLRKLHNKNLQHYVSGKKQHQSKLPLHWHRKKDAELKIIGFHKHDLGYEIHNIHVGWNDNPSKLGPCEFCKDPHFINNCDEKICHMCKPNIDNHTQNHTYPNVPGKTILTCTITTIPPHKSIIMNGNGMN